MIGIDESIDSIDDKLCDKNLYIDLTTQERNAITNWILKGHTKGYICGPFDLDFPFPFKLHVSPLFVVPKPGGKFRPIAHLSYTRAPWQYSVNDCVLENEKHVQYIQFKAMVKMMHKAGKDAYMFTADAKDAYYRIPIHPSQYRFMGIKWLQKHWLFLSLQMGLASAPRIYTRFGDAVEYIVVNNNKDIIFLDNIQVLRHYIDDYFGVHPDKEKAITIYNSLLDWFDTLGIPTTDDKCVPPGRLRRILGFNWNSHQLQVELPNKKRKKALKTLCYMKHTGVTDKKWLERIDGRLQHISIVVFPGKAFVRRFEMLIYDPRLTYGRKIHINPYLMADIEWWIWVLSNKSHVRAKYDFLLKKPNEADVHVWTDAASTIGMGGISGNIVFQIRWEDTLLEQLKQIRGEFDIHAQEMLGSLVGSEIVGPDCKGKSITFYNDNPAAAAAIISKAPPLTRWDLNYMTREFAKIAITNQFYFWGVKIDGSANGPADALSRFKNLRDVNIDINKCIFIDKQVIIDITNKHMRAMMQLPLNGASAMNWSNSIRTMIYARRAIRKRDKNVPIASWNILNLYK